MTSKACVRLGAADKIAAEQDALAVAAIAIFGTWRLYRSGRDKTAMAEDVAFRDLALRVEIFLRLIWILG